MLTDRQHQIVRLFCDGSTYRQVAAACGISPETVNPTLKAAARNLGVGRSIARRTLRSALEAYDVGRGGL